jgi:hypothetical protein
MLNGYTGTMFGADPEGFFRQNGELRGSERFIPSAGLLVYGGGKIVRDGVQFELNPTADILFTTLAHNIKQLFTVLNKLTKEHEGLTIDFSTLVEVPKKELESLSPETRVLGCHPSLNFYGVKPIRVNPNTYRKRSTGGHLHFGLHHTFMYDADAMDNRERLVPLLDVFVGLVSTLIDRDPNAAERRKNYGRAGEYRLPKYGLEYRTPSNFWLKSPVLLSLICDVANTAISIGMASIQGNSAPEIELSEAVDIDVVTKAINTSSFELAMTQFKAIIPFMNKYIYAGGYDVFQLGSDNISKFIDFAESINASGIETYFPSEGLMDRWINNPHKSFRVFLKELKVV